MDRAIIIFNSHKPELNEEPKNDTLVTELQRNTKKKYDLKFKGGEVLNENTSFRDYAFISDNKIYIYNPENLKKNEISYTKVYDLPSDIKVMNIRPGYGADINFIDYNDIEYTLHDDNIDNNNFILGVQFHPEDMNNTEKIYNYFLKEIIKRKNKN